MTSYIAGLHDCDGHAVTSVKFISNNSYLQLRVIDYNWKTNPAPIPDCFNSARINGH